MGKATAVVLAVLATATMTLGVLIHPASADPPNPALPAAADPITLVLSPLFDEVSPCGNVSLALVAADVALRGVVDQVGGTAPAPVAEAFANGYGQVFLVGSTVDSAPCTSIPTRKFDTRCNVDDQVGSATGSLPIPSGLPLPVDPIGLLPIPTDPAFLGALVDALAAAQGHERPDAGVSEQLAGSLGCTTSQRLTRAPVVGGGGGGVSLAPHTDADAAPSPKAPSSRVLGRTTASIDDTTATDAALEQVAAATNPAAPKQIAAASTTRKDATRHSVYRGLAVVLGLLATWGFVNPRRRDEAGA